MNSGLRNIKIKEAVKYAARKIKVYATHKYAKKGEAVILGAYDGQNAGDMVLLRCAKQISADTSTSYEIGKIKDIEYKRIKNKNKIIFGGGATYTLEIAKNLAEREENIRPDRIILLGVDVQGAKNLYSEEIEKFMKKMRWISVRQKRQKDILKSRFSNVVWHPDISFKIEGKFKKKKTTKKILGVNVMPFMVMREKLKWKPRFPWSSLGKSSKKDKKAEKMSKKYIRLMRRLVREAISKGYEVRHHPFAIEDEIYAKSLFRGIGVKHLKYTPNVKKNIERFDSYNKTIVTRLHAHIFSMMGRKPMISFAYSRKCISLFEDLNVKTGKRQIKRYNMDEYKVNKAGLEELWIETKKADARAKNIVNESLKKLEKIW
jgi:polysaccharide pyruvyl transferase WcaK-like protein